MIFQQPHVRFTWSSWSHVWWRLVGIFGLNSSRVCRPVCSVWSVHNYLVNPRPTENDTSTFTRNFNASPRSYLLKRSKSPISHLNADAHAKEKAHEETLARIKTETVRTQWYGHWKATTAISYLIASNILSKGRCRDCSRCKLLYVSFCQWGFYKFSIRGLSNLPFACLGAYGRLWNMSSTIIYPSHAFLTRGEQMTKR